MSIDLQSSSCCSYRQTKNASMWSYTLNIKDCNNYEPRNSSSEFNSTALYMREMNSSLCQWPTTNSDRVGSLDYGSTSN